MYKVKDKNNTVLFEAELREPDTQIAPIQFHVVMAKCTNFTQPLNKIPRDVFIERHPFRIFQIDAFYRDGATNLKLIVGETFDPPDAQLEVDMILQRM